MAAAPAIAPHPVVARLDAASEKFFTPCGAGSVIWRKWGSGPPLVLFHGGTGSWMHWVRNIQALARHFSVWAPDLPGFGESDYPAVAREEAGPPSAWDLPDGEDFTGAPPHPIPMPLSTRIMVIGIERLFPRERICLVGFSFGGTLAANVTAALPRKIEKLVLVGSGGIPGERLAREEMVPWRHIADPDELAAAQRRNLEIHMFADPQRIDDVAVNIQTLNTRRSRSRRVPRRPTLFASLERARPRLAGIWGRHDHTARGRIDELPALLAAIDRNAAFHVSETGGHWVAYECAEEFNDVLLSFLRSERRAAAE